MCDYCALSVKRDFQDTELLVSIFPFLVDACKDLVSCKCISLQMRCWELEASAAPPGCLEIPILCLCLGVGVRGGWRRLEEAGGSARSLYPALGSATSSVPGSHGRARCRGRAEEEPVLFPHPVLGEKELFQKREMSLQ